MPTPPSMKSHAIVLCLPDSLHLQLYIAPVGLENLIIKLPHACKKN